MICVRFRIVLPVVIRNPVVCGADLFFELIQLLLLLRRGDIQCWRAGIGIFAIVKEGKHPVVLVMADWIELMRVTLGTTERKPQPHNAGCINAIDHSLDAKLLGVRAAFLIDQRVTMKSGGNELLSRWVGK